MIKPVTWPKAGQCQLSCRLSRLRALRFAVLLSLCLPTVWFSEVASAKTTIEYWIWDLNQKPATDQLIQMFHSTHPHIEVPLEFVKFLGSKEAALVLGSTGTVIPAHRDAVMSYFKPGVSPLNQAAFGRAATYGHPLPVNRYIGSGFESRIDVAMADILDGKVGVPEALKAAEDDINGMIKAALFEN